MVYLLLLISIICLLHGPLNHLTFYSHMKFVHSDKKKEKREKKKDTMYGVPAAANLNHLPAPWDMKFMHSDK